MYVPNSRAFRFGYPKHSGPAIVMTAKDTNPERIAAAITIMQAAGEGFRAPLFRAVLHDEIALAVVCQGQTAPLEQLDQTRRPAVVVFTDDDDATRLGPDGWPGSARIMRWAKNAMVHGSGGQPEHYAFAVVGAVATGRLVLVETSSSQVEPWVRTANRFIPLGRILCIKPIGGGVHPVPMPTETMQ